MPQETLISVGNVSKKYCRTMQRSMLYGIQDIVCDTFNLDGYSGQLRKNEFWAVDDVSFEVKRGECLGIIGSNGAGKSTLLKMLNGIFSPDKGRIAIRGRVGALIELGAGFHPMLTGRENIYINGAILGLRKREMDCKLDEIVAFAELEDFIDTPVKFYSSGMHMKLGFAIAVHVNPDILLVDEVLAVGDVAFRMRCFQHFRQLNNTGTTVVLVSHNMIDVNRVCNRVMVIESGKRIFTGGVQDGVNTYEERLLKLNGLSDERAPNSPAWIDCIELFASDGSRKTEFETGDDLLAEVKILSVREISQARLIVHINTPSLGVFGAFSSPHKRFTFSITPMGTVVQFWIRKIPLLPGSYNLRVNLYGPEIQDFFHAFNASSFKIIGPSVDTLGYGECHTVRFEHDWKLKKNSNAICSKAVLAVGNPN